MFGLSEDKNALQARVCAAAYRLTAGSNNRESQEAGGSTEELGQPADIAYEEINRPGLLVPWIYLPDNFYL